MPLKKKKKAKAKKRVVKKRIQKRRVTKKKVIKRRGVKKSLKKAPVIKKKKEKIIGVVTHYFPKVRAAVVKLKTALAMGDTVKIKGHTTDFTQTVTSLQIDRQDITSAKKGQEIGLLVDSRVRQHDLVYKA